MFSVVCSPSSHVVYCTTSILFSPPLPQVAELIFLILFSIEMVLKFAAYGFFGEEDPVGYFKDPWNLLDFVIVVSGYLQFIPGVSNVTSIRILRVLRPLRAVNSLPGLRIMVQTLLSSLPGFIDVIILLMFLVSIYAIIGLQLWRGKLSQRCYEDVGGGSFEAIFDGEAFCSLGEKGFHCSSFSPAINSSCMSLASNPGNGLVGFDNIGLAFLTIFQAITMADWSFVMFWFQDTHTGLAWIYWVSLVFIVSFFAVNLFLAVVDDIYSDFSDEEKAKREEEERRRLLKKGSKLSMTTSQSGQDQSSSVRDDGLRTATSQVEMGIIGESKSSEEVGSSRANFSPVNVTEEVDDDSHITTRDRQLGLTVVSSLHKMLDDAVGTRQKRVGSALEPPDLSWMDLEMKVTPLLRATRYEVIKKRAYLAFYEGTPWLHSLVSRIFHLVESKVFNGFIILIIFANTVTLSLEHDGMSDDLKDTLEKLNLTFTIIFILEMVLKLIGLGFKGYARDKFNLFDAFIVIISLLELVIGSAGSLSVFRTLRVFRLAKNIPSLRILLNTVLGSLASVGYMTVLLVLFLFMFAILGMQLFSGSFAQLGDEAPRSNYDNLWFAFLTVFQIITGDDWTSLMATSSQVTSKAAVAYYLAVTIFGAFLVINLFIAILLSSFGDQDDDKLAVDDLEGECFRLASSDDYQESRSVKMLARKYGQSMIQRYEQKVLTEEANAMRKLPRRMEGFSFKLFSAENPVRKFCWGLIHTSTFQWFIIVAILINCVLLAMENPSNDEETKDVMFVADWLFAMLFLAEMFLKMIAMGVFRNEYAYLRDSWNQLDALVVVIALVALAFPGFSVARSLRALRPLRVIVRSEQVKVVVNSLYRALPAITNVFFFCMIFWIIFGILGVNLFAGKFYTCECADSFVGTIADGAACEAEPLCSWDNSEANFDNLGNAIVTLFQVATLSGWTDIMYTAIDAPDKKGGLPREDNNPELGLYFLLFVIICAFFTLNLFVGVVIDNFNRLRQEFDGSAFLTAAQRQWVATKKLIQTVKLSAKADVPRQKWRAVCFSIVTDSRFDPFIMSLIVINMLVMMMEYEGQSESYENALFFLNVAFIIAFSIEALLKIVGLGWIVYWREDWNKFDFILVIISWLGLIFDAGVGANVIRVFRIGRIFRLVKRAKSLKKLFDTLIVSIPSLWNIGSLLFVIFFMFAVLGVSFFGEIKIQSEPGDSGFPRNANFENFGKAMLTLFM